MKKAIAGLLSLGLVFTIGTSVFASDSGEDSSNFEDFRPFMEEMHPNWSEEDLETMYNNCHGEGERPRHGGGFGPGQGEGPGQGPGQGKGPGAKQF
ncbi:hypothetical protein [Texcoconibacillus texcoconensis]|uniref:FAD/FMN-containing dehydrogenase n=1 Tax=Texcoconibacillus texcoconensis TaxID=1095777 RepID=A0A840QT58_9BACI|nr:hypothetical protein [Texcoconibacillus texcoconensis]MBB5174726.1 hypothetical protein [Texcoconibacillus texcoconensis]